MRRLLEALSLALLLPAVLACGPEQAPKASPDAAIDTPAQRFFPLEKGRRWVYDVFADSLGQRTVEVTDVDASDPESVLYVLSIFDDTLEEMSDEPVIYTHRVGEGIFCDKCNGFLLRNPLEVGQSWPLAERTDGSGERRVTARGADLRIGEAVYSDCLVIDASDASGGHVETVYAPDVGPIRVRYFEGDTSEASRVETLSSMERVGDRP